MGTVSEQNAPEGHVLIDESLILDGLLGVPVTVRLINGEKWATLGERAVEAARPPALA
jgi:hypothetical protein